MRSKMLAIFVSALLVLVAGCSRETIPNKQKSLPEDQVRQFGDDAKSQYPDIPMAETRQWTKDHQEIQALIEEGTEASMLRAIVRLNQKIFGENTANEKIYSSAPYAGYMEIYVNFLNRKNQITHSSVLLEWVKSKNEFYQVFVKPCAIDSPGSCQLARAVFSKQSTLATVVVEIAEEESDIQKRLSILGMAFDFLSRRRALKLEELYLDTVLEGFEAEKTGQLVWDDQEKRKHLVNMIVLVKRDDWRFVTPKKISRFEKIEPWKYSRDSESSLVEMRESLIQFVPLYAKSSDVVKAGLQFVIDSQMDELKAVDIDLTKYPAYSDIDLNQLSEFSVQAQYLTLQLYFQKIKVEPANGILGNLPRYKQSLLLEEAFEIAKILVRWDIARLGIDSTLKLKEEFLRNNSGVVTNQHFQNVLDWSKSLTPGWTEFHTKKVWIVKTFLEANISLLQQDKGQEVYDFFEAINRNILKTVVYPNMMGFSYHMAKSEWSATIKIWWWEFTLDTTLIMDYMINGQYKYPWFNFTEFKEQGGHRASEKISLYRSEIYDVLYYFFTTKTHEVYGIQADSFLKNVAETVFKERRALFEATFDRQKEFYLLESSKPNRFFEWCEGISNNVKVEENLNFYTLYDYITPEDIKDRFVDGSVRPLTYFGDTYEGIVFGYNINGSTNDRYRMELLPMLKTFKEYKRITEKIKSSYPGLKIPELEETQAMLNRMELLGLKYWGMQKHVAGKMGPCLYVGEKESKRRVKALVFGHADYLGKIVHPLMKKIKEGTLGETEANQVLREFHGFEKGQLDRIVVENSGEPQFIASRLNFFLRTRKLLTKGFVYSSEFTESIKIPAVVGSHLKIPLPSNFLEDPKNNVYLTNRGGSKFITFFYSDDVDSFVKTGISMTTDESRAKMISGKWTSWDYDEMNWYTDPAGRQLEFYVLNLQIENQEYLDLSRGECLVDNLVDIPDETCVIKEEPTYEPIIELVANLYDAYRITDEDERFFDLTGEHGWIGGAAMDVLLRVNSFAYDSNYFMTGVLPFTDLAGVMDATYHALDSDYLGTIYENEWTIIRTQGSDKGDLSCAGRRDGCYWSNERFRAKEFFWARGKKAKIFFNYDLDILVNDYEYTETMVRKKFDRLLSLEDQADEYLAQVKGVSPELDEPVLVDVFKEPLEMSGLRQNYRHNRDKFRDFFRDDTESFFLKKHDWNTYLIK